ncbi:esterase-like activity of phytase family protein [Pseudonocardia spinosispora]|uniref:esterase-like activity of phytase family protein n=1 Tax=Pseudonocardia spinosispora TaxID=103441 RepID=UPI0003FF881E|nr:esterase-like activity of phytase family protein [Pseudonocardia spinosispora]
MRSRLLPTAAGIAFLVVSCAPPSPPAAGSGTGPAPCSSSVTLDRFSDVLDKTTFEDTYVGNLSGLAVDPDGRIDALSDRSSLFSLDATTFRPTGVVPLADQNGKPLDSEAVAVDGDGTRLITSEVEPSIRRYTRDGKLVDSLPVPDQLRVAPDGRAEKNLTFEGLTLASGGNTLIASMEGPLSGDAGDLVRFQTWMRSGSTFRLDRQFGYRVDPHLGVSEIAALDDGRLLVLERGFKPGFGNTIHLYLADPRPATDVTEVRNLTRTPDVRLPDKILLADVGHCPALGATARQPQPNPLLDNIEGMTVTARRPDGSLGLLLVSDDNENPNQITRLYELTVRLPAIR